MSMKIIYLINFLDYLGMAFVFPLMNPHILSLGGSLSLVGLLHSLSSGAQLFASPVIGSWSDTRGRKLLLVITLCIVFISNVLSGLSSIPIFFLSRILYGIVHQTDPLLRALIADIVPQEGLTDVFNNIMATAGLAFIIGPIIGGALYELLGNFVYISIILCTLDIITISTTFYFIEEKEKVKAKESNDKQSNNKTFLQSISDDLSKVFSDLGNVNWSKYGDILAIRFFCECSFSSVIMNMGVILMQKFSMSRGYMGLAIAFFSVNLIISTFISSFLIQRFYKSDKSGYLRILQASIVLTLSFCVMIFTNTAIMYLSVFVPLCAAKALFDSTWMEVLSSRTTESDKGVMMGAATSMISLSGLICPLVGGFVGDFIGVNALLILPLIPAIIEIVLIKKVKHRIVAVAPEKND
ncbi:hypothetical protein ILUMI_23913 [Ignelater luminosus]|uniref:Major facilitator superfamily (MFS) profile domain-containing protein n=1 Tax=Ignelater luminosus TaxID=2038154 RepID=A0A8K0C767_IGNLU|nr:hypothetical protein ILUMI_23913 [Ignelater luminosus]